MMAVAAGIAAPGDVELTLTRPDARAIVRTFGIPFYWAAYDSRPRLSGRVKQAGQPLGGVEVEVQFQVQGDAVWRTLARGFAGDTGRFQLGDIDYLAGRSLRADGYLRARLAADGDEATPIGSSNAVGVFVVPAINIGGGTTRARTYTLRGHVRAGATASGAIELHEGARTIARKTVRGGQSFAFPLHFTGFDRQIHRYTLTFRSRTGASSKASVVVEARLPPKPRPRLPVIVRSSGTRTASRPAGAPPAVVAAPVALPCDATCPT